MASLAPLSDDAAESEDEAGHPASNFSAPPSRPELATTKVSRGLLAADADDEDDDDIPSIIDASPSGSDRD
jgi:hypothetical protein